MLPLRLSDTKAENARYINAAAAVLADLKTRRTVTYTRCPPAVGRDKPSTNPAGNKVASETPTNPPNLELHGCLFFEASHFPSAMGACRPLAAQTSLPFSDIFFPVFNTDKGNPLLTSMIPTQKASPKLYGIQQIRSVQPCFVRPSSWLSLEKRRVRMNKVQTFNTADVNLCNPGRQIRSRKSMWLARLSFNLRLSAPILHLLYL